MTDTKRFVTLPAARTRWQNVLTSRMTDDLRAQLRQYLSEHNLSQTALAATLGTDRHTISRALTRNGSVPPIWQKMLDALGLELVLRPKRSSTPA